MHTHTGSRWRFGMLALTVLAAALALPPPAPAAHASSAHHDTTTVSIARLSGWSAGPARPGLGFVRAGGSRRVREVQRLLRRIGYRPGPVDGLFGPRTEAAVIGFQHKNGLRRTGVVGNGTLLLLRQRSGTHWPAGWSAGAVRFGSGYTRATGSDRVRQVQRRLRELHYRTGPTDGLFGPLTERAVKRFQARHGLEVDGIVGPRSLAALGLLSSARPRGRARPVPAGLPPRGATPRERPAPSTWPSLPLAVIVPSLVLLGVLVALLGYLRTMSRLRRSVPQLGNSRRPRDE
jgi:peptidoglycan hydrolase-like protein with peptidoglycan-binding domain